jgi:hypothetical protein
MADRMTIGFKPQEHREPKRKPAQVERSGYYAAWRRSRWFQIPFESDDVVAGIVFLMFFLGFAVGVTWK